MKNIEFSDYKVEDLSAAMDVVEPVSGNQVWSIAMVAYFYFEAGHEKAQRSVVADIFSKYIELFSDVLKWSSNPKTGRLRKFESDQFNTDFLLDEKSQFGYENIIHGGKKKESASPFYIKTVCLGGLEWRVRKSVSCVAVSVGLAWFIDNKNLYLDFLDHIASSLPLVSGVAGLGESLSPLNPEGWQTIGGLLSKQYLGLIPSLAFSPYSQNQVFHGRVITVSWINWLGEAATENLGGFSSFEKIYQQDLFITTLDGVVTKIQITDMPDLLFRNPHPLYVLISKLVEPIVISDLNCFSRWENIKNAQSWQLRFLNDGQWWDFSHNKIAIYGQTEITSM